MTTSIKIRTNGNYVAEARTPDGVIVGKAGPGSNVESDWIGVGHDGFTVKEREATGDEIEGAKPKSEAA